MFPLNMGIFHSYVSLPRGNYPQSMDDILKTQKKTYRVVMENAMTISHQYEHP
jgi:hypothetical protein